MGQTLGMRHNVLNAGSQKMPGNQTKHAHMSGNGAPPQKMERRVRRTRNALGDALVALMHEKPFAAIRIQDVLDRAQIAAPLSTRITATKTICFSVTLKISSR